MLTRGRQRRYWRELPFGSSVPSPLCFLRTHRQMGAPWASATLSDSGARFTPRFSIAFAQERRDRRRGRDLRGLGDFRDLRQLSILEGTR